MILQCLFASLTILGYSSVPQYKYAFSFDCKCNYFDTFDNDIYTDMEITYSFRCYFNDEENYTIKMYAVGLNCSIYDEEGDLYKSLTDRITFNELDFNLSTDYVTIQDSHADYDLDCEFHLPNNVIWILSVSDTLLSGSEISNFDPTCKFDTIPISYLIYSTYYSSSIESDEEHAYWNGYDDGYNYAHDTAYYEGYDLGYNEGYTDGYNTGSTTTGEASVIFAGILNVAMIPVNFFLAILNFEVFGINIGGFVTGLLTLAVIYIIWKIILGHGGKL